MEIKNTKRKRERELLLIALVVVLVRPLTVTPILLQPSHCPLPPSPLLDVALGKLATV